MNKNSIRDIYPTLIGKQSILTYWNIKEDRTDQIVSIVTKIVINEKYNCAGLDLVHTEDGSRYHLQYVNIEGVNKDDYSLK